jgi:hypothetical protein
VAGAHSLLGDIATKTAAIRFELILNISISRFFEIRATTEMKRNKI